MTLVTPCLRQAAAMPGTSDISKECEPGFSIMRSVVSGRIMASIASGEAADVNAHRAQDLLGEFARGSVDRVRKERMTARPHERKERRRRGGQARRKGPCARGVRPLERLHRRIERLVCGTAVAPVAGLAVPAGHLVMDAVHHVLARLVKHRRGAHHGRIDAAPLRVPVAARVHELRCGI